MAKQTLGEIFGYPVGNDSPEAQKCRKNRLCPFNNKTPNCTKDGAKNPLGICSVTENGALRIVCPIRFRQKWTILNQAVKFFFPEDTLWTCISNVKLYDGSNVYLGKSDFIVASYDARGKVCDFGVLEIHIANESVNLKKAFASFFDNSEQSHDKDYAEENHLNYSQAILRIQERLLFHGSIFHHWGKKKAIIIDTGLYERLPKFIEVLEEQAEVCWLIYELVLDEATNEYMLTHYKTIYTLFEAMLFQMLPLNVSTLEAFMPAQQEGLNGQLEQAFAPDYDSLSTIRNYKK